MLIQPPATKPCEPPAGIARLAGALRARGVTCSVIDANLEGLHHLLGSVVPGADTWSRRAHRHLDSHLALLRDRAAGGQPDRCRRAVSDIGRLLHLAGQTGGIKLDLANYADPQLNPMRGADLRRAAEEPSRNPFSGYFEQVLLPRLQACDPQWVGVSITYLSQALCALALIGLIKSALPATPIIIGGGLVTSWLSRPGTVPDLSRWVDRMVAGPGEAALLAASGIDTPVRHALPDYSGLFTGAYLSPGPILPYSASDGCWWRRCRFCPEQSERRPYRPVPASLAVAQLQELTARHRPALIHLLDNALSPALLNALAADPPGAPWYGFARIAPPLDDPEVCRALAAAGCVMLKLGLESGDQRVLDALDKGISLTMAERVLRNLRHAGIATYIYLLFGTPAEDEAAARRTLDFAVRHHDAIGFLNLAIFNLPTGSPEAAELALADFYDGELALYRDFKHPSGWSRAAVRQFLDKTFKRHPAIQPILRRDPPVFTSNHAAFFTRGMMGFCPTDR